MSAAQALRAARDAGVRIGVDDDAMTLDADPCAGCGTDPACHAWLHSRRWTGWYAGRKAEAVAALSILGVSMRASP